MAGAEVSTFAAASASLPLNFSPLLPPSEPSLGLSEICLDSNGIRDKRLTNETPDLTDMPSLPMDSGWRCPERCLTVDIGRGVSVYGSGVDV